MADDTKLDLKSRVIDWVFTQGISTVLLLVLCVGAYHEVPKFLTAIEANHMTERSDYMRALKDAQAYHEKQDEKRELAADKRHDSIVKVLESLLTEKTK